MAGLAAGKRGHEACTNVWEIMMPSRGFRLSRLQLERIFQIASDAKVNVNHVVKCLLDLGLGVWGRMTG